MKIALIIIGFIIFIIGLVKILNKYTTLLLSRCKVCKQKRNDFFFVGETNARYDKALKGCKIGDEVLSGGEEVCTNCAVEYKLFDNFK